MKLELIVMIIITILADNYEISSWNLYYKSERWCGISIVCAGASASVSSDEQLSALHEKNEDKIKDQIRFPKNVLRVFYYLESNPIIDIKKNADVLGITFNTVSSAVKKFLELGILEQNGGTERYRTFTYAAYLDILKEGTE